MSKERNIIAAAIQSRKAYDKVAGLVQDEDFTEQAKIIWKAISEWYGRDADAARVDPTILGDEVARGISSPKHKASFQELVKELAGLSVSPENVIHDFVETRKEVWGAKLASALLAGGENIDELIQEYQSCDVPTSEESSETQVVTAMPIEAITAVNDQAKLIKLWPSSLNRRLDGGVLPGHHVVVFARPEMGKTLFLVNSVAGFLSQGLSVLYVNNEEPIHDIALRTICRLSRRSKADVLTSPAESYKAALDAGYGLFTLAGLTPGTPHEIETLVKTYAPKVLIIDQLRNLAVKDDNRVQQLEKVATAARNIGKRHGLLVVSVTQAGDSASGKAILEMGDCDSSNTGIPAQADVMVGIGATKEDEAMGRRVLTLCKNKRGGNHDYWPVRIDTTMSRIINMEGD